MPQQPAAAVIQPCEIGHNGGRRSPPVLGSRPRREPPLQGRHHQNVRLDQRRAFITRKVDGVRLLLIGAARGSTPTKTRRLTPFRKPAARNAASMAPPAAASHRARCELTCAQGLVPASVAVGTDDGLPRPQIAGGTAHGGAMPDGTSTPLCNVAPSVRRPVASCAVPLSGKGDARAFLGPWRGSCPSAVRAG